MVLIYIYMFMSVFWSRYVFCLFVFVCVISNQSVKPEVNLTPCCIKHIQGMKPFVFRGGKKWCFMFLRTLNTDSSKCIDLLAIQQKLFSFRSQDIQIFVFFFPFHTSPTQMDKMMTS